MPDEMRRSFERWYRDQTRSQRGSSPGSSSASSPESGKENRFDPLAMMTSPSAHLHSVSPGGGATYPTLRGELNAHFSRARMRTSFDPDLEIPRLQRWFEQNQHPSRDQMLFYLNELNSLESRRGRKPLDLTNIIYWFKNARAAQRRAHRSPEAAQGEGTGDQSAGYDPDESIEERLSPEPREGKEETEQPATNGNGTANQRASTPTGSSEDEHVPVLPNRNAVYVVSEPLHRDDSELSGVVRVEPEDPTSSQPNSPRDLSGVTSAGKNSPHSNDSGNHSDVDAPHHPSGVPLVIEPQSPSATPQNLTTGTKRSSDSLDSDLSDDDDDDYNDVSTQQREHSFNTMPDNREHPMFRSLPGVRERREQGSSGSPSGSPSPPGLREPMPHRLSPLQAGILPQHPLLTPPVTSGTSPHQPPPAHQQPLHLPHPHLPHPLNMPLFPHPLYSPLDASAMMSAGMPRAFKDCPSPSSLNDDHRKKRSRVFIDPLTEIPKLEKWFLEDTHPSSYMIEKYTEDLNRSEYRQRFPKLEPKNVQLWFKNHRAKVKRQRFEHSASELMGQHPGPHGEMPPTVPPGPPPTLSPQ